MFIDEMAYPGGTRVLAWRLDEDGPRLMALCRKAGIACGDLADLPRKRQREKAAERLLLCHAFGQPVTLLHDGQGAPSLDGMGVNISITHTMQLVALAWNEHHVIGLDAEQCDRAQVVKVRDKFLNPSEKAFVDADDLAAHIIAWTAKEAVIKAERNSAIDWTDGICLEPFSQDGEETVLVAVCDSRRYRLTCRPVHGHYITVAVPAVL